MRILRAWPFLIFTTVFIESGAQEKKADDNVDQALRYIRQSIKTILVSKNELDRRPLKIRFSIKKLGLMRFEFSSWMDSILYDFNGDGNDEWFALSRKHVHNIEWQQENRVFTNQTVELKGALRGLISRIANGKIFIKNGNAFLYSGDFEQPTQMVIQNQKMMFDDIEKSDVLMSLCGAADVQLKLGKPYWEVFWRSNLESQQRKYKGSIQKLECVHHRMAVNEVKTLFFSTNRDELWSTCPSAWNGCKIGQPFIRLLENVGHAFLIVDVDEDGVMEILTTSTTPPGVRDRLTVWKKNDTKFEKIYSYALPMAIVDFVVGDVDRDYNDEIVVVTKKMNDVMLWALK